MDFTMLAMKLVQTMQLRGQRHKIIHASLIRLETLPLVFPRNHPPCGDNNAVVTDLDCF